MTGNEREQIYQKAAGTDLTPLPGSVVAEWVRCGTASCRCASGLPADRHGPYLRHVWRHDGHTHRRYLRLEDAPRVLAGIALHRVEHPSQRALQRLVRDLTRRSAAIVAALGAGSASNGGGTIDA